MARVRGKVCLNVHVSEAEAAHVAVLARAWSVTKTMALRLLIQGSERRWRRCSVRKRRMAGA